MTGEPEANPVSPATPYLQTATKPSKPQRNRALDFTKGALVLLMVLYHWVNYFIGPQWGYYHYLRFLTPSFIFITGFLVSSAYLSKYTAADPRLSKRLFTRGLKLLAIFVALNAARTAIVPLLGTGAIAQNLLDLASLFTIFVSGNFPVVGGKLASFSILVPISYLLMLAAVLVILYKWHRYTFHLASALLLLSIAVLALTGLQSGYLEFVAIGMLGILAGFVPIGDLERTIGHAYVLVLAYGCYLAAITFWAISFPLLIVGVTLSVMIIYRIGLSKGEAGVIRKQVILLGQYSLFGYISQIAILQVLSFGFHRAGVSSWALGLSFVAAFALTVASVAILDRAKSSARSLDRAYRAVFA